MWLYLLIGCFFIAIGLAVHVFKLYFLISGYNTMPKEKKANVDTKGLGRLMGIYAYLNGGVFILLGILQVFNLRVGAAPAFVFLVISTVYMLLTAQKYDGNLYDENGRLRKGALKQLAVPVVIAVVILIFVVVIIALSSQPTKVTFLEEGLQIHGMYGEVYAWESIESVSLMEDLPNIEARTNGSALGSNLKGHFRTTEFGPVKLFVNTRNPPYIYLRADGKIAIFNIDDPDETSAVYQEILKLKAG